MVDLAFHPWAGNAQASKPHYQGGAPRTTSSGACHGPETRLRYRDRHAVPRTSDRDRPRLRHPPRLRAGGARRPLDDVIYAGRGGAGRAGRAAHRRGGRKPRGTRRRYRLTRPTQASCRCAGAIVDKLAPRQPRSARDDPDQVWVTIGATQGLQPGDGRWTLGQGDEVLLPDPGYTTFTMNAHMLDAVAGAVPPGTPSSGFMPDVVHPRVAPSRPALACSSSTRPRTPWARSSPESVAAGGCSTSPCRHDLWVISDEVYEYFTWGDTPHVSTASLDYRRSGAQACSRCRKTYAMTGIRIGYLVTPPGAWSTSCARCRRRPISCANTPGQHAAIAAITGDQ